MTNQTKKTNENLSPVVAAVAGAVIGAGVAVAGAVVLGDEERREKIKNAMTDAKDQAVGYIQDMHSLAEEKKGEVKEDLLTANKKVKDVLTTL
jgi:gas vesicle protein